MRVGERADLVERLVLQLAEADGDVGDLHAGIVDVVLDLDLASEEPQQPAERVAERRVAQVPDVRGLVRVDGRVLDDRLALGRRRDVRAERRRGRPVRGQPAHDLRRTIQEEVDVAVRRRLDPGEAFDLAERADDLLRDRARRLAQASRQLERERNGEIAERAARRHFDRDRGERRIVCGNVVETPDGVGHVASDGVLNG